MDPVLLIVLVCIGGAVASVLAIRRTARDMGGGPRLADRQSVLVGGALIVVAAVAAYVMLASAMT